MPLVITETIQEPTDWMGYVDPNEPRYCLCNQVCYGNIVVSTKYYVHVHECRFLMERWSVVIIQRYVVFLFTTFVGDLLEKIGRRPPSHCSYKHSLSTKKLLNDNLHYQQ